MDDKTNAIKRLIESAEDNIKVAEDMYNLGHYSWCLFMWQLGLEKLVKALLVSQDKEVLYIHNLTKLAQDADLNPDTKQCDELAEITKFNLEARYENYKLDQYKKATKEYTDKWTKICKGYQVWIISKINQ